MDVPEVVSPPTGDSGTQAPSVLWLHQLQHTDRRALLHPEVEGGKHGGE